MPPGSLGKVLQKLGKIEHPDLLAGTNGFEDAGVFRIDSERALVQTLDFFPPIVDDPRWFGRIAAANSLSDVYAMGGTPLFALNLVCWPSEQLGPDVLAAVLEAGAEDINDQGESFEIISEPTDLVAVRTALQDAGIDYDSAEAVFVPSMQVELDADGAKKVFKLIEALEDSDEVQNVYANFDVSDEVMAEVG